MFTALTNNNEYFLTVNKKHEELHIVKQDIHNKFRCPVCNEQVMLKVGKRKIPHFSHYPESNCNVTATNESIEHLMGKKLLFESFKSKGVTTRLEWYLKSIKQIADVFIECEEGQYSIEFQCSTIPIKELVERTAGYYSIGVTPVWLLRAPPTSSSSSTISLSPFQQSFTRFHPHLGYYITFLNVKKCSIVFITNLLPYSSRKFICTQFEVPLKEFTVPFYVKKGQPHPQVSLRWWVNKRNRWLSNQIGYSRGIGNRFLKEIYLGLDLPMYLPLYVGLPVQHLMELESHPVEWQYYLWADILKKKNIGESIYVKDLLDSLTTRIRNNSIKVRSFPLVPHANFLGQLVEKYFTLLQQLEMIRKESDNRFILIREWEYIRDYSSYERHYNGFFRAYEHILML